MELQNKIDTILNVILVISLIASFFAMKKFKSSTDANKNEELLTKNEKIIVWITCLGAPLFAGLIYYFGWKKTLPQKAKQANKISWTALLIAAFILFTISAIINK